jgi:hypothetical protein
MNSFKNAKKDDEKCQLQGELREDEANSLASLLHFGSKP